MIGWEFRLDRIGIGWDRMRSYRMDRIGILLDRIDWDLIMIGVGYDRMRCIGSKLMYRMPSGFGAGLEFGFTSGFAFFLVLSNHTIVVHWYIFFIMNKFECKRMLNGMNIMTCVILKPSIIEVRCVWLTRQFLQYDGIESFGSADQIWSNRKGCAGIIFFFF